MRCSDRQEDWPVWHPRGVTLWEVILVIVLLALLLLVTFGPPRPRIANSAQARQINNAKQILTACALFANDAGAGRFPNGHYDPETGKFTSDVPAASAEECFQDLYRSGILKTEDFLFWLPRHERQCAKEKPEEDGKLTPGENCWDYIAGMQMVESNPKPLIFEASDKGNGKLWTEAGGHPWKGSVVVGFTDGASVRKVELSENGELKERGPKGVKIDLCVPSPGSNDWPNGAVLAPATPVE